ncbi:hypothetical protein LAV84_08900 [Rhizobium sp. VS19-DR104.2]|uniref:Uncharacterized protein n=1 Tax=Rhizobium rhododendri TaxID=2506430 RepID=A0ABY8IHN3_9HYPH|nr:MULTISPECIES: hypothetical protein [Rhizobium]MBZ5760669.1 hypothetical protein [Rhizobium sp. VS19-DR96]MBZ5765547.1 hypothetical protein [Rhizobium sp. VS19-DR129.2]MBZ5774466.1 hypothetical protein [Rhizobium sp. VS19-DRK62.2]MBZ5784504.1 hypothetical protein [Rhizobium sp. VS19-DR121]MBZ5801116.1 hypothetical protein [Rhizobium sp. VS19-DR181]MBZ5817051.1 hypothetical protein [Rhizobium sp. VS19-DR183]MBZ5829829.1 hypothetical protein [Rhizobium sp. VS19-DR104.2]MBZ5841245.1 hypothet
MSPFNVRSPLVFVELFETGHEINYFDIRRVATGVIVFGCLYDQVDHAGKTAAAASALRHRMIDLRRHDQLPTVFVEQLVDDCPDIVIGDVVTAADQHGSSVRQT